MKNKPYVKIYIKGVLANKITKDSPYLNWYPNRSQRRKKIKL